MKKLFTLIICLLFASSAFSQDKDGFFRRLKNIFVVHDTVYIYTAQPATDSIAEDDDDDNDETDDDDERSEGIPIPVDTLDTHDMFRKVVLFDNGTWLYYNIDMPFIPYALESDHWITEKVHSYSDVALKDLPDTVPLLLIDSLHRYCIPHPGPITSQYKFRWKRAHKGIDIGLHTGDAIYSAFDGIVRAALPINLTGGYGNVLVIRHPNGLETYYGHLSHFIVKSGDIVKALYKHYFSINSHYGMTDQQSLAASKKAQQSSSKGSGSSQYYKVKKGDTLDKIARRNGTTVKRLCQLNGLKQTSTLKIGQRLRVK